MSMLAEEGQPKLKLEHVICVSARVRDLLVEAGLPIQRARIIHGGTDIERFPGIRKRDDLAGNLKLLYAGQLARHKGVHTAIEAMVKLVNERGINQITLTLVGSGHPDYEGYLRDLVERERLHDYVTFHEPVSKDKIPAILQQFDVLIFPSIYEEPLARMTQEAMAADLEAKVLLGEILQTCLSRGLLSEKEYELLMTFKIDGLGSRLLSAHEGLSDVALRHRVQRIVERLRRQVQAPPPRKASASAKPPNSAAQGTDRVA